MATQLPEDYNGESEFTIKNTLDELEDKMVSSGVSVDDLDLRTTTKRTPEKKEMVEDTMKDPDQNDVLSSKEVQDFNDKYEVDLDNSNPMFIFPENKVNTSYVNLIRQSNESYANERDLLTVRPAIDIQQQIFNRLQNRQSLDIADKVRYGVKLSQAEEKMFFENMFQT
jgi:hypothetical protein